MYSYSSLKFSQGKEHVLWLGIWGLAGWRENQSIEGFKEDGLQRST